jgi:membrane protease subunit (stomatin/prohibitin family)
MLFVKNFLPDKYKQPNAPICDLTDMDNEIGNTLFDEVVGTLSATFANYTNDPSKGNRMSKIQGDQLGLAQAMSATVEQYYQWKTNRGLEIVKTALLAIEYDETTKALMADVQKADALSGARGNAFMQQAVARGVQAAGENGGGAGMAFMGMGMNAAGGMMGAVQQQPTQSSYQPAFNNPAAAPAAPVAAEVQVAPVPAAQSETTTKLLEMKQLLDAGAITQEDYDAVKKQLLGL